MRRPEFDAVATERRATELEAQGAHSAAERARTRLSHIRRLARVRNGYFEELTGIEELAKNARVQMELIHWTGPNGSADELLLELESRVDGLDSLLRDEPASWVARECPRSAVHKSPTRTEP